jgi:hypothetical protein
MNVATDYLPIVDTLREVLDSTGVDAAYYPPPSEEEQQFAQKGPQGLQRQATETSPPRFAEGEKVCHLCTSTKCPDGTPLLQCSRCKKVSDR